MATRKSANDQLVEDLRAVVDDAREIIREKNDRANSRVRGAANCVSDAASEAYDGLRKCAGDVTERLNEQVRNGVKPTEKSIAKRPFPSVGIALGVGALVGLMLGRGRD